MHGKFQSTQMYVIFSIPVLKLLFILNRLEEMFTEENTGFVHGFSVR